MATSKINLNMEKFTKVYADRLLQLTGVTVRSEAKKAVRKDTWQLHNSIRLERTGQTRREVSANTPYAAAQEFGRPDLPNYGFTPYMRPAAQAGVDAIPENSKAALEIAEREARV